MRVALTPAFLLHRQSYRETSALLDVFTKKSGRVRLVAKGVHNKKGSQSGLLQLYQPLLVSWVGRGGLCTMTAVESSAPPCFLRGQSALCGLYINELVVKLLPLAEADIALFTAYQSALCGLCQADNTEIVLRLFEKQLLNCLGYGFMPDNTIMAIDGELRYIYQPGSGLIPWQKGQNTPSISARSLQHLFTERDFDDQSLAEIKQLMRIVIQSCLDNETLQSRQIFAGLKNCQSGQ